MTRDANAAFKRNAATIQALAPAGESVPYLGNHYWASASPLLYYGNATSRPPARRPPRPSAPRNATAAGSSW